MTLFNEREYIVKSLSVVWAVVGVVLMLLFAIARLSVYAFAAWEFGLTLMQGLFLIIICIFMAYSEGYKGFYLNFSPRFAARVKYIYQSGSAVERLLSPLFCFGYFGTTRSKQIVSIMLTTALITLVLFMHYVPQPWRGIIDAGVVVGLSLGVLSIIVCVVKELAHSTYLHDPQVPNLDIHKND